MADDTLVILKDRDCTDTVTSLVRKNNHLYEAQFIGSHRWYVYSARDVQLLSRVQLIDPAVYIVVIGGLVQRKIAEIQDYDTFVRIMYEGGYRKTLHKSKVKLVKSLLDEPDSRTRFDYFKTIAHRVGLRTDDGESILGKYFNSITRVRDDTVLAAYLTGELGEIAVSCSKAPLVLPFGFNASQIQAVENAMQNKVSIVEGPPGTGKTQTILNILANTVLNDQTVAVVSNNNSATDNVFEKLQAEGLDFIAARLGRAENKEEFVANQTPPDGELLKGRSLNFSESDKLTEELAKVTDDAKHGLQLVNDRAELQRQLSEIKVEYGHFSTYFRSLNAVVSPRFVGRARSGTTLRLVSRIETTEREIGIFSRFVLLATRGLYMDRFYDQSISHMSAALKERFYQVRIDEVEYEITKINHQLDSMQYDSLMQRHRDISMQLLWSGLAKRYTDKPQRTDYRLTDLWQRPGEFVVDYPIILSTTYSLRASLSSDFMYDYVIIDEASQVDLATFVLALSCAKNVIVVGDQKQLPNVIDSDTRRIDDEVFAGFQVPGEYRYSQHSALSGLRAVFSDAIPTQMLREHYRCHPLIIGFCNKMFYDNELVVLTPDVGVEGALKLYPTVPGNHARDDHVNQRQIDETLQEVVPREGLNLYDGSVGIVSPYRNHARALQAALQGSATLAATVDKFQGREKDVIILNTVDNKITDFASDPNRLNVAVSRAKRRLIVVTNSNENTTSTGIDDLIRYIRYHGSVEEEGAVRSIFDYLYRGYYKNRTHKARRDSSPAEDLMNELLQLMRADGELDGIGIKMEYPLGELCNTTLLSSEEERFARLSRVDFVLFRELSKEPILAIEVDGWQYHRSGNVGAKEQRVRDGVKNDILQRVGLPLVRFPTTGSGEKQQLIEQLKTLR